MNKLSAVCISEHIKPEIKNKMQQEKKTIKATNASQCRYQHSTYSLTYSPLHPTFSSGYR